MPWLQHVQVGAMDPRRFEEVISPAEFAQWLKVIARAADELRGRVVWNVNSTAKGGGVAEMLWPLLGYSRGAGVDARWVVIGGEREFFPITKRLHNRLHGTDGDGGELGPRERSIYERNLAMSAAGLSQLVQPHDFVILHDPQTAGLVPGALGTGAGVIWRCHIGVDRPNGLVREAWNFLLPYLGDANAYVFSRAQFVWDVLAPERVAVIQPSIDAFSPKNAEESPDEVRAILVTAGLLSSRTAAAPTFTRSDGTPGRVATRAQLIEDEPLGPEDQVVTQVSRWDALKDPLGILQGFTEYIAGRGDAHLMLAGPSTEAVADDPEGAAVYAAVRDAWGELAPEIRHRVHLASLPMADSEENAAIVNAIQRHSDVVVQKSLAEGFGLTVAEAMWKARPVVASRVGGIQDQIVDGVSGVLLSDPHALEEFGEAVVGLLSDPRRAERIGTAAHERVRSRFLGPRHLGRYFELLQRFLAEPGVSDVTAPAA
jgi:trehalose synthase